MARFLHVPVYNNPVKSCVLFLKACGCWQQSQAKGTRCLCPQAPWPPLVPPVQSHGAAVGAPCNLSSGASASGVWKNRLQFSHIDSNKAFTLLCLLLGKTNQGQRKNMTWRFFPAASGSWCLTEVTPAGKVPLPLTSVLWPRTGSTGRVLCVARGLFVKWSMTHTNGLLFVLLYSANIAFNDEVFAKWSWTHPKQDPEDKTKHKVITGCLPRGTDQCPVVWA